MSQIFKNKQRGFLLPVSIFIITVLSFFVIAAFKLNISSSQKSIFNIQEKKSFYAAKLGLDYGMYQAIKNSDCSTTKKTIDINEDYFRGFKFSYICEQHTSNEAGINTTYYKITSYGCNTINNSCPDSPGKPSNENYTEKQMIGIIAK